MQQPMAFVERTPDGSLVERLAAAGFDGTVYDEAIVTEEPDSVDPARPTLAPGSAPEVVLGSHPSA